MKTTKEKIKENVEKRRIEGSKDYSAKYIIDLIEDIRITLGSNVDLEEGLEEQLIYENAIIDYGIKLDEERAATQPNNYVRTCLERAKQFSLEAEVVVTALGVIQSDPTSTIEEVMDYALENWNIPSE